MAQASIAVLATATIVTNIVEPLLCLIVCSTGATSTLIKEYPYYSLVMHNSQPIEHLQSGMEVLPSESCYFFALTLTRSTKTVCMILCRKLSSYEPKPKPKQMSNHSSLQIH